MGIIRSGESYVEIVVGTLVIDCDLNRPRRNHPAKCEDFPGHLEGLPLLAIGQEAIASDTHKARRQGVQ